MTEQTRNEIIYQKARLEAAIQDGTIKDPALFWAGLMSQNIRGCHQTSISCISEYFDRLKAFSEKYDEIIFGRMK